MHELLLGTSLQPAEGGRVDGGPVGPKEGGGMLVYVGPVPPSSLAWRQAAALALRPGLWEFGHEHSW